VTEAWTESFALSDADTLAFARLSGDFNPLHIDPVYARRTQFGAAVGHGLHLLLKALDRAAGAGLVSADRITSLSVTFSNPVRAGASVNVRLQGDASGQRMRMTAESAGLPAFSAQLEHGEPLANAAQGPMGSPFRAAEPKVIDFPLGVIEGDSGSAALGIDVDLLRSVLPHLCASQGGSRLAGELCATTRIVGMQCPGLHSIFAGLKLRRRRDLAHADSMAFRVQKVDPRFRRVVLAVEGAAYEGTLETFFRPAPVLQRSLAEIMALGSHADFADQKALVVGGSRGLGELTAKILLAGGASVSVTYASGKDDALQLCREAEACDRRCESLALDVLQPLHDATSRALREGGFTHLYYFASPRISKGSADGWDHQLYDLFARYYLRGMAEVSRHIAGSHPTGGPCLFMPSTVFIDTLEPGFAEYGAAKAAAEALCGHLARRYASAFAAPRLPRMRTDQTVGLTDDGGADPFPILDQAVRLFSAQNRP